MYFNRRCKITFVCHGGTIYTEEERLCDTLNYPPLSESGIEETENVVKYLKTRAIKNDAIYTSPSIRTVQSAMIISKAFKTDYNIIEDLTPRKIGCWSGLTFEQILEKYPEDFTNLLQNPDIPTPKDGETSNGFVKRIGEVIENIIKENIGNRIIIVTHPDIIQAAICSALEITPDKIQKIYIRTGSLTQISYFDKFSSLLYCGYLPL